MSKTKTHCMAVPTSRLLSFIIMTVAVTLALLAMPHTGHAQGIVRGAQEGAAEGDRVAGPLGGLVGGAVGAGVGGAVGAVDSVLGIPSYRWHHHCHGYHDGNGYFHCYRY